VVHALVDDGALKVGEGAYADADIDGLSIH
jgi:hypothetical protein